jgi:hypothetical protein
MKQVLFPAASYNYLGPLYAHILSAIDAIWWPFALLLVVLGLSYRQLVGPPNILNDLYPYVAVFDHCVPSLLGVEWLLVGRVAGLLLVDVHHGRHANYARLRRLLRLPYDYACCPTRLEQRALLVRGLFCHLQQLIALQGLRIPRSPCAA